MERLDARVTALEAQGDKILMKLDGLGEKIGAAGRPQWQIILGAAVFVTTLLGFVGTSWKAPLETTVARQDADIRALQGSIVPRAEHAERWGQNDSMLAAMRDRVTRDMQAERAMTIEGEKRLAERIERLEGRVFYGAPPGKRTELTRSTP